MIKSQFIQTIFIKSWHPYFWIAILSFLLYGHVVFFSEYTHYDDHFLIVDNYPKIDELSDIKQQFFEDVGHQGQGGSLYRPMLNVSFILGTQISGIDLWGHFLINVLLHTGSCLLLFVLLLNLGVSKYTSFISSVVFTIHPALTQSIAWISGRNDSLLAIFILLCFISFLKFLLTSSYKWYFSHLLFFAFALFTKETTIVFPILLLFYIYSIYKGKSNTIQIIGLIAAWIIVFANWYILRIAAQITPISYPLRIIKNIISDLWIAFFYFGKIFWPVDLTFAPLSPDISILPGILSVLFLLIIIICSKNRDWKMILFGILWFGLLLVPTFTYQTNKVDFHIPYYEHRLYVPMIGIVILLSSLTFKKKISELKKYIPFLLGIILFLGLKSYYHTFHFRSFITLRQYSAESSPHDKWLYSPIERMNVPVSLAQQLQNYRIPPDVSVIDIETNDSTKNCIRTRYIIETLEKRFKNDSTNKELVHSLAIVNYARGFFVRAEELFITAKRLDPENYNIPYNFGIFYYDAHRPGQAEKEWLLSLELNREFGNTYTNLAYLFYEQGEIVKAWTYCQLASKKGIIIYDGLLKEIKNRFKEQEKSAANYSKE
jgi:protein O-mannosyl-transferase